MYRVRFIIGLILLAISLLFAANILRGVLTMLQPNQSIRTATRPTGHDFGKNPFTMLFIKRMAKKTKHLPESHLSIPAHFIKKSPEKDVPEPPTFFQLIEEDPATPLTNPHLNQEENSHLTLFLANRRAGNAQLSADVLTLFGTVAFQQTVRTLTQSEQNSYLNAKTCSSVKQFNARQIAIDQQTKKQINKIFEQHKESFNYKSNSGSTDWKNFYKQANNFRKAQD